MPEDRVCQFHARLFCAIIYLYLFKIFILFIPMSLENSKNCLWQSLSNVFVLFFFIFVSISLAVMIFWSANPFQASLISANVLDIDEKVEIVFTQPIIFWDKAGINISPQVDFLAEISQDRKVLTISPKNALSYEQKYDITLNDFAGAGGLLMRDASLSFYTGEKSAELISFQEKEQQFGEMTLSEDKYIPPASSLLDEDFVVEPYIKEGRYIDVSISRQAMTLFEDGVRVNQFLVSTGKYGMPTPLGRYSVKRKEVNHWSSTYRLWMPYSMNFSGAYYIHELPYWPSGYREGENHLGIKVSHGCIRLGVGPAKYVFNWSEIGTPIYIHY